MASAGRTSSRTMVFGCESTQTIERAASSASIQGGPTARWGAYERINAETASAPRVGATRRTSINASRPLR